MKAVVAERGQVTIPKTLREKLGIKSGTVLDFEIQNGTLIAVKADLRNPVDKLYGCLGKLNTDKIIEELRGKS